MRYSTGIKLEQLIVHLVDPRRANGFVLSERCIPLKGEEKLVEYFTGHIQNSLQDTVIQAAQFSPQNGGLVAGVCEEILNGNKDLVDGSQILAQRLYSIINKDHRISPGNIAVCIYQTANHSGVNFLALLKIDPSDVLRQNLKTDSEGKKYVSFQTETDIMPTTRESLQKCAFIKPLELGHYDYDMMLLDRQVQKQVAQFFTKDFLEAKLTFDDYQKTELFYESMVAIGNELRPELTFQENKNLKLAVDYALSSNRVNTNQLMEALSLKDQYKQKIEERLADLLNQEFTPDQSYVQKLTRRLRYSGDHNLRITVNAEGSDQVIHSVKPINEPGKPPYHEITIHTEKWKEETH